MNGRKIALLAGLMLGVLASSAAADWLQFRGPGGLGISAEKNIPFTWGPSENVAWKTELPGAGSSSPIIVGDKIIVTCYSGYGQPGSKGDMNDLKRHVVCLDRSGKILWTKDVPSLLPETPYSSFQSLHGYASSTPCSDGKNVYVFFGKSGVFAFNFRGNALWASSVGKGLDGWGSGTSPVLYKDLLIINASVESGPLVALNKNTGERVWQSKGKVSRSWNTPLIVELPNAPPELVVNQRGYLKGFNPDTGAELWSCEGLDDYVCPSVVANAGIVYVIGARSNTAIAVRAGGKGDVSKTHLLWTLRKGSNVSSPVYHAGHLYWTSESKGMAYCVDADKGKLVYEQKLSPTPGRIYASPTLADGRIYYVSRENGTYVVEASPTFKLVAHNSLGDKSIFNASPAVSDGHLYVRSDRYLYCIGK